MRSPLDPVLANPFIRTSSSLEICCGYIYFFIAGMLMIRFVCVTRNTFPVTSCISLRYIISRHPNSSGLILKKYVNHNLPFLDVLIEKNDPNFSLTVG